MQKRILSIFLCVLLVLSFAACGTTPENPTDTSVNSSGTTASGSSDSVSASDSVNATDSVSSGTVTNSGTDSVTDVLSSGTTDSDFEPTDFIDGSVDSAPGGDDLGGGDLFGPSDSEDFSDYNPEDPYWTNTDTGILGSDDTTTDTSGEYTDGLIDSGSETGSDPSFEPDQNTDFGSGSDDSDTQDTNNDSSSDSSGSETVDVTAGRKFLATDITDHGIVVYNLDACNGDYKKLTDDSVSVVWEWIYSGDPNGKLRGPGLGVSSAKIRYSAHYKRDVIITCSSQGWAGVIDYENCSLLWESDAPEIANAHSVELLPNGDLVVAASQTRASGKSGLIYFALSSGATTPTHTIVCDSSHGVSWDPTNNCLWVLDNKEVYAVKVQNPGRNGKLQVVEGSAVGGFSGGHAFSPVAGSPGKYWIGAGSDVFQFDTKSKTVTKCADILQQYGVKGIASFADGTVVFSAYNIGGNPTQGWSSDGFRIVTKDGKSITVPFETSHREFYKVQPFTRNYQ